MDDLNYVIDVARWARPHFFVGLGFVLSLSAVIYVWHKLPDSWQWSLQEIGETLLRWVLTVVGFLIIAAFAIFCLGVVGLVLSWIGAFVGGLASEISQLAGFH